MEGLASPFGRRLLSALTAASLLSLSVLGSGTTAVVAGAGSTANLTFVGTGSLSGPDTSVKNLTEGSTDEFIFGPEPELPRSSTIHHVAAADVPQPAGNAVVADGAGLGSFNGISHLDQRTAGGGNQFSLEPPDQGLCIGNPFVVETVNDAVRVFSTAGAALTPTQTLNGFLGLAPAVIRSQPPVFGPFVSDPKCYFDVQTRHFFLTALAIATDPATGAFRQHTSVFIAVSRTADPTGNWNIFELDTTDADHQNCPCLGDQPLIGADANGFYQRVRTHPELHQLQRCTALRVLEDGARARQRRHDHRRPHRCRRPADAGYGWYLVLPPAGDLARRRLRHRQRRHRVFAVLARLQHEPR